MSIKNSNDNIGNRNRDSPACSAVPQPTTPPRASDQVHRPRNSGHRKEPLFKMRNILHRNRVTGFVTVDRGKRHGKKT
jgi:hypothetical protein